MGGRKAGGLQMVQVVVVATTRQQENEEALQGYLCVYI